MALLFFLKPNWLLPDSQNRRNLIILIISFFIILILSCLYNWHEQNSSFNNLFWTAITYGSSFAALFVFTSLPYQKEDIKSIFKFTLILTLIEIGLGYYQMIVGSDFQSINPFNLNSVGSAAAGDFFVGTTFDVGIGNQVAVKISMITLLFFPYWLANKSIGNSIVLVALTIGWLLASAIYTLIIGLFVLSFHYFITNLVKGFFTLKVNYSVFLIVVLVFLSVTAFMALQPKNVNYVKVLVLRGYNTVLGRDVENPIGKIVYYKETFSRLLLEYPHAAIIGVGPGNYSSRSAWLVSGVYLDSQPKIIPVTPSKVAKEYTMQFWRNDFITKEFPDASSITYMPFSSWVSVFSEVGILGLITFAGAFILIFKMMNVTKIPNSKNEFLLRMRTGLKIVFFYIVLIFFFDNLFEWPLVMGQFFIFVGALSRTASME
jgi:hypothetical protein